MPDYTTFFDNISIRNIQDWLNITLSNQGLTPLKVDGLVGRKTWGAIRTYLGLIDGLPSNYENWSNQRKAIAIEQSFMNDTVGTQLKIDGLFGPNTRYGVELWQNFARDLPTPLADEDADWPSEAECEEFYGKPGKNHHQLALPYPMRIAWDLGYILEKFTINKKCAASAHRVLDRTLQHYGHTKIQEMGLDIFSGCYNPRNKRGSDSSLSMHAYACAIDFDDTRNQWRWTRTQARMARPEYNAWWTFWEEEGWVSLGRERNYDWMHVQAATI